jgi:hypothetical protein
VIGFAVLAFTAVLVKRAYQTVGVDDLDEMKAPIPYNKFLTMNLLLVLPLLIPMLTAALCLLVWQRPRIQKAFSIIGASFSLVSPSRF